MFHALNRRFLGYVAFAGLLLCGASLSASALASDQRGTVTLGNEARTFLLHVPDRPPPVTGFPLILAFHGGGMQGLGMRRVSGLDEVADARNFIVVYPDGIDRHWNDGRSSIKNPHDDVRFVSDIIAQLQHRYKVNPSRIYATGISNGALFAERLACDLPDKIAAIAPVAGSLPTDLASVCHPRRPLAVLQIDGTADPIMPFEGGAVATLGGAGEGGNVQSVAATASFWARNNGCSAQTSFRQLPPVDTNDPTRVTETAYQGCPASAPVTVLSIVGGGHAWPGGKQYARPRVIGLVSQQFGASQTITDFFLSLPPASEH